MIELSLKNEVRSSMNFLEDKGLSRNTGAELKELLADDKVYMAIEVSAYEMYKQLAIARRIQGHSLQQAAELIGVSVPYISRWETGSAKVTSQQFYKVLSYINMTGAIDRVDLKE